MRYRLVVATSAILTAVGASQVYTATPPVCFSFNDTATLPAPTATFPTAPVTCCGPLVIHFTAPVTATLDRLDLVVQTGVVIWYQPDFYVTVLPTPFLGGPVGTPMGTYTSGYLSGIGYHDWVALGQYGQPGVLLAGGQTYALSFQGTAINQVGPVAACNGLTYNPAGATQLQYQATPYGCGTSFPPTGTIGLMARFRGASCGPGPLATVGPQIGMACGVPGGGSLVLASTNPPVLGGIWSGTLYGGTNMVGLPAFLFWSGGVNPTGSPITVNSPCLNYLDSASLSYLYSLGAEPFATTVFPSAGPLYWQGLVPSSPFLAGLVLGIQAFVLDPAGSLSVGGFVGEVSNALKLTIGFGY